MGTIFSIILAVVVAGAAYAANNMLEHFEAKYYLQAGLAGVIVFVVNFFTPKIDASSRWIAPIMLAVMIAFFVLLCIWWRKDGSNLKEMIPFLVIAVPTVLATKAAAKATAIMIQSEFWKSVVEALPWFALIATVGYMFYDYLMFQDELKQIREGGE